MDGGGCIDVLKISPETSPNEKGGRREKSPTK